MWIKIDRNVLEAPDDDSLLRQRVNFRGAGRVLEHIAAALQHQGRRFGAVEIDAAYGEAVATLRAAGASPVICTEARPELYEYFARNAARLGATCVPGAPPLDRLLEQTGAASAIRLLVCRTGSDNSTSLRRALPSLDRLRPALCFAVPLLGAPSAAEAEALLRHLASIGYERFLLFDRREVLVGRVDRSLASLGDTLRSLRASALDFGAADTCHVLALPENEIEAEALIMARIDAALAAGPAQRIAVVRLDNLGDHVLGAGLLRALRETHASARVAAFIPEALVDLYARCPFVDDVVGLPQRDTYLRDAGRFQALMTRLAGFRRFDLVLNPRYAEDWYAAGAVCQVLVEESGLSIGFRQVASPIRGYDANTCFKELIDERPDLHTSRYAGVMARRLGAAADRAEPEVWFTQQDSDSVRERYRLDAPYVVVGCGASFAYKLPEAETYRHIVRCLIRRWRATVVLIGTASDATLARALASEATGDARVVSTVGELKLFELSALLHGARLYVGPDSGPMHMAAAAGAPVLEIGWVPDDYPVTSRGEGTAGRCWAPWSDRAVTVRPSSASFARRSRQPGFALEPIRELSNADVDRALETLLGAANQ